MKPLLSTQQVSTTEELRTAAAHGVTRLELDMTETGLEEAKTVLKTAHQLQLSVPTLHYDLRDIDTPVPELVAELTRASKLAGANHVSVTPPDTVNGEVFPELSRFAATRHCSISIESRGEYANIPVLNAVMEHQNFSVSLHTKEVTQQSAPLKAAVENVSAPIRKIRVSDAFLGEDKSRIPGTGDISLDDVFALVDVQSSPPFIVLDLPRFTVDAVETALHHFENTLFSRVPDRFQFGDNIDGHRVNAVPFSEEQGEPVTEHDVLE